MNLRKSLKKTGQLLNLFRVYGFREYLNILAQDGFNEPDKAMEMLLIDFEAKNKKDAKMKHITFNQIMKFAQTCNIPELDMLLHEITLLTMQKEFAKKLTQERKDNQKNND